MGRCRQRSNQGGQGGREVGHGIAFPPEVELELLCDFDGTGNEMVKRRLVVVLSSVSTRLCNIVPFSTRDSDQQMPWHCIVNTPNPLPSPYDHKVHWLKGDMVVTVSFHRLSMPCKGKDRDGHRLYVKVRIDEAQMRKIRQCVAVAFGISPLDFATD